MEPDVQFCMPPSPQNATPDYSSLRKSNPANEVMQRTQAWFGSLPQDVRPYQLTKRFPRVANAIADAWDSPAAFGELATSLLYDFRGNRTGFSAEVVRELRAMREYYYRRPSPLRGHS